MGKIIVEISNNLEFDTRVRRQVGVFSEIFDEVIICARTVPNDTRHIEGANIIWRFFEQEQPFFDDMDIGFERIRTLSEKYGLWEDIRQAAPIAMDKSYMTIENNNTIFYRAVIGQ
jgi:hypothetical protein